MNGQPRKDEKIALEILKKYFHEAKYQGLEIHDKPDLQNNDLQYGIEVIQACFGETRAMQEAIHPQNNHSSRNTDGADKFLPPGKIEKICRRNGGKCLNYNGIPIGFASNLRLDEAYNKLREAINKKQELLKSYMDNFCSIDLCIIDQLDYLSVCSYNDTCIKVCREYRKRTMSKEPRFAKIYVIKYKYNRHQLVACYDVASDFYFLLSSPPYIFTRKNETSIPSL